MSHDIVLYVSEENNCRLVYRYGINSDCAGLSAQLLVLDQSNNKCAGLWINTTDYKTPLDSAVEALVATTPNSMDHADKLEKLFLVLLTSGTSSIEVAQKLSPLFFKNPDLALQAKSILQANLTEAKRERASQYETEAVSPAPSSNQDSLIDLIKSLLMIIETSLSHHSQRLFSRPNDSADAQKQVDNASGMIPYSK